MESVTILHNNCNIRRVDDPAMTSIGYVISFPSITRFGVHFVLLLTLACYPIIRYCKWSSHAVYSAFIYRNGQHNHVL